MSHLTCREQSEDLNTYRASYKGLEISYLGVSQHYCSRSYFPVTIPQFRIRLASTAAGDSKRLLKFFDSQLPWLATVGSESQWGSKAFGDNEEAQTKYRSKFERSETQVDKPFSADWIRVYIAEAEVNAKEMSPELKDLAVDVAGILRDGTAFIPVAAMVPDAKSADYIRSILPEQDDDDPFMFLA